MCEIPGSESMMLLQVNIKSIVGHHSIVERHSLGGLPLLGSPPLLLHVHRCLLFVVIGVLIVRLLFPRSLLGALFLRTGELSGRLLDTALTLPSSGRLQGTSNR